MEHSNTSDWYVAESYKGLETVGGIFEKNGKEYINVVLKSGKIHTARVYRTEKAAGASNRSTHVIYDLHSEYGFSPLGYIYIVRHPEEEKLQGYCHFDPRFGAYLKCTEDIFDLPFGCNIVKLHWIDITDEKFNLLPKDDILKIIKNMI